MGAVTEPIQIESVHGVVVYRPEFLFVFPPPSRWEIIRARIFLGLPLLSPVAVIALAAAFIYFSPPQDRSNYITLFALWALFGILQGAVASKGSR
jgi:hypothetical protein